MLLLLLVPSIPLLAAGFLIRGCEVLVDLVAVVLLTVDLLVLTADLLVRASEVPPAVVLPTPVLPPVTDLREPYQTSFPPLTPWCGG